MILVSDGMKSASRLDLDLLLILKTTNTLTLNGEKGDAVRAKTNAGQH